MTSRLPDSAHPTPADRRTPMVVAALIVLWLAATAWARALRSPDEGRYVGVAFEMLRSGDWLTPTLDGLPFFHKPPLFYWITATSMSVFGPNPMAARAAPIIGAALAAWALYLFLRRWSDERLARWAVLALVVQPLFYLGAQFANMDMLVAGLIGATVLLCAHAVLSLEQGLPHRHALLGAYALAAVGVLAKGLIGAVVPLLVLVSWLAMMQRWRAMRALVSAPGLALFALIAAPWFVVMQWRHEGFLDYFFVVQHFRRYAGGGFNNVEPFWFYPAVLMVFSLPGWPWLFRSLCRGAPGDVGAGALRLLMWVWLAVTLLFFSIPASKPLGYVLPALVPLAFLMADGFALQTRPGALARRWAGVALGTTAALSLGAVLVLSIHPAHSERGLAKALAALRLPDEPVVTVDRYDYDLPFYARLEAPVGVVAEWSNAAAIRRDDWRNELADAGRFAPGRALATLREPAQWAGALCDSRVSWVIGAADEATRYPFLALTQVVYGDRETQLWRVDAGQADIARALHCAPRPEGIAANRHVQPTFAAMRATHS